MKKRFSVSLIFIAFVAIVLTGCGGSPYLLVRGTDLAPATFYSSVYVNPAKSFENVITEVPMFDVNANINNMNNLIEFSMYAGWVYDAFRIERCLVSALDYLCAINSTDEDRRIDDKTTVKLYEYNKVHAYEYQSGQNIESIKAVVLVKASNNNADISTFLFYKPANEICELAQILNETQNADLTYTFRQTKAYNIQTKTYTFAFGSNTVSASFNEEKGCLSYDMTMYMPELGTSPVKINKSIYKYANNISGFRMITNAVVTNSSANYIYEQVSKDFYHRAKYGIVKNVADIISLETIKEDDFAKVNVSDMVGFSFVLDLQKESDAKPVCTPYGQRG